MPRAFFLMLLALTACPSDETDTDRTTVSGEARDQPCNGLDGQGSSFADCMDGCTAASASDAHDRGRLACVLGNEPPTPETYDIEDQGEGPSYQAGYEACFFDDVARGYADGGC